MPPGACEAIGQGLSFDQLHHQRLQPAAFLDPVQRRDVGMVHRCQRSCLVLQASETPCVEAMLLRQHLQRHVALQPGVPRAIDLTHPAVDQWVNDLIPTQPIASLEHHHSIAP